MEINNECLTPSQTAQATGGVIAHPHLTHITATLTQRGWTGWHPIPGWTEWFFNNQNFTTPQNAKVVEDSPGTVVMQWSFGSVMVTVTPGSVYGSAWAWDQTHFPQFVNQLYSVPAKGWTPQVWPGSYFGPPQEQWSTNLNFSNGIPEEYERFSLPDNQSGMVTVTPADVYTVVYTGYVPAPVWDNVNISL